ncbi:hypothetical protein [Aureibacter tunicatorum]|uniref:Cytochrome c domain-containing protein n=1 Tax=Aureibacter tunicatorum TaxID=866807 RepID=A0AAE3XQ43_9BACT|nr:hypothetical protein [Aureibacter tunicatorum]MDR6240648.1 hypothetical protein [Aureibacter tunicatorum]BDD06491.1 hypothetical protein AUTU_39740 [Aureibacter tunicatorum]
MRRERKIFILSFLILCLLSFEELRAGEKWIGQHDTSQDKGKTTYLEHIKPIIEANCLNCHSGRFASDGLSLNSYERLVAGVKERDVLRRINDKEMPMPASGMLSVEDRKAIKAWADNGFEIGEKKPVDYSHHVAEEFRAPDLKAVNIEERGFEFMEKMQGHWVGDMFLLGQDVPWFSFDFRAINTSQLHGLFEGGSMGNLFNTFFVAEYKGVKTIMIRNGGILGGIYRTSYFVLTYADGKEYLFEDAYGGKQVMSIKVTFKGEKMKMLAMTSKLGAKTPTRHIEFEGKRYNEDLYQAAAEKYNFPTQEIVRSFPDGMPLPDWGEKYGQATSASYIMMGDESMTYEQMGKWAQDPIQMSDLNNLAQLPLEFKRSDLSKNKNISIYLTREPLTNSKGKLKTAYGYITEEAMNQVLLFPEIDKQQDEFLLTYLHMGKCYLTFVVDNDYDFVPSKGDYYSHSIELNLKSGKNRKLVVDSILNKIK